MVHAAKHLSAQQLADFEEALAQSWQRGEPNYLKHAVIADIVNKWEVPHMPKVTADAVGKHRRKVCSCE